MKKTDDVAHEMRQQTDKRIADLVEKAWQQKKAEMGFKDINCEQPHETTDQKLRNKVSELEAEKLRASKLPPSPYQMDAVATKEIEDKVKDEMEQELDLKMSATKKELSEKMD